MTDKKISQLDPAEDITGDELIPVSQLGATRKLLLSSILTEVSSLITTAIEAENTVSTLTDNLDTIETAYVLLDCSGGHRTFYLSETATKVKVKRIDSTLNDCIISSESGLMTFDGQSTFELISFRAQELRKEGNEVTIW